MSSRQVVVDADPYAMEEQEEQQDKVEEEVQGRRGGVELQDGDSEDAKEDGDGEVDSEDIDKERIATARWTVKTLTNRMTSAVTLKTVLKKPAE